MKKILLIVLVCITSYAAALTTGDQVHQYTFKDQFDKKQTINSDINIIIVSFEKDTGAQINNFLASKEADFLSKNNAVFVANISGMPSLITKMFALPKMKKYKHHICLIYDDENKDFLQKEEKSTVYKIKDGIVTNTLYISSNEELEKVFQ